MFVYGLYIVRFSSVGHVAICFNIRDGRTDGQTDHDLGPCNILNDKSIFIEEWMWIDNS